jgi:hypothetical protein
MSVLLKLKRRVRSQSFRSRSSSLTRRIIHLHIPHAGTRLLGHQPPRQEIRSVLGHGQEHLIARVKPRTKAASVRRALS